MNAISISYRVMNKPPSQALFSPKRATRRAVVAVSAAGRNPGKKFAEEMKTVTMKLHKVGQKEEAAAGFSIAKWEPSLEGYLNFLVNSKLIYDALERIVDKALFPQYAEFRETGLERSEKMGKDLEWFEEQGHTIPQPSYHGIDYALYLNDLSEKDPPALICHFYMTYFGHTAGGRMIGKRVEEKILKGKELEFYKYEGELPVLMQNVRDKLNALGEEWSREEKDQCLNEIEKSFKLGGDILRLVLF